MLCTKVEQILTEKNVKMDNTELIQKGLKLQWKEAIKKKILSQTVM